MGLAAAATGQVVVVCLYPFLGGITMSRLALSTLVTAVALFAGLAQAREGNVPGTPAQAQQGVQGLAPGPFKLQKTYMETANPVAALASGFNPYGTATTVNCTVSAGCMIQVSANVQLGLGASANAAAVCFKIDGNYMSCPYNHIFAAGSGFEVMSYQTSQAVALGTHVVETEIFSSQAATLYRFNNEIQLFK
jgi:hypothetical protein